MYFSFYKTNLGWIRILIGDDACEVGADKVLGDDIVKRLTIRCDIRLSRLRDNVNGLRIGFEIPVWSCERLSCGGICYCEGDLVGIWLNECLVSGTVSLRSVGVGLGNAIDKSICQLIRQIVRIRRSNYGTRCRKSVRIGYRSKI